MSPLVLPTLFLSWLSIIYLLVIKTRSSSKNKLPPGPIEIPVIGQILTLLAIIVNTEGWIQRRVEKYGYVSKFSLFGTSSVLVAGPAANKFMFTNADTIVPRLPERLVEIIGSRNILMLHGEAYRRARGALVRTFLNPDAMKIYVNKMDENARQHIKNNWLGQKNVKVSPLMKSFTFDVICSLMFGIERGAIRDRLIKDFADMFDGLWAVVLGLPFLNLNKSKKASKKIRKALAAIIQERKAAIEEGRQTLANEDLITCLIGLRSHRDSAEVLTDDEIIDNAILVMMAGYETTSNLITFMMRQLANDPIIRERVILEQEEIANNKTNSNEDALTWDDIAKMKYTWQVAMETLRMIPPVVGGFRRVLEDVEYNGYLIPKGWNIFWMANVTHMDGNIFQEPAKFDPARFENPSSVPPYSFVPFGGGPRICPGMGFAKLQTLVMMHHLVTKFKWKLCCKEDNYSRFPTPSPAEGLPIILEPRNKLC